MKCSAQLRDMVSLCFGEFLGKNIYSTQNFILVFLKFSFPMASVYFLVSSISFSVYPSVLVFSRIPS